MGRSSKKLKDDIAVRKKEILELYHPAPGNTQFYEKVKTGEIAQAGDAAAYFLLNQTRLNLGLPEIDLKEYRTNLKKSSAHERDILLRNSAILCIDSELAEVLPFLQLPDQIESTEEPVIVKYLNSLSENYPHNESTLLKLACLKGWTDAYEYLEK